MSLIKKPYELSVWSESLNSDGIKEEKMGAIIGAHDMSFLGKATNVVLKTEIKGTATLTFDMPSKFFDSEIGDYIHNELADTVKNESKIKLHYKDKWYEFYVKKITENKKFKAIMYSYSCSDSFIDELSRTGYDITFDDKLNNSVDEAGIFMEDILEQSVWDYTPEHNIGDFTEFNEQKFYKIPLSQFGGSITAYKIDLEVKDTDFYLGGKIKPYIKNYAAAQGLDWDSMDDNDRENFLIRAMQITNVLTNETRILEYGDDLARERELFWDCYYKDNGRDLLSEENSVEITTDYIYVPITDLSMIMGSIYEDNHKATDEPALYGTVDSTYGYALQPSSLNPRALIQFIAFTDGDILNVDEENILSNNDLHYVIPIEEWNEKLEQILPVKGGLIYWKQPCQTDGVIKKTLKYSYEADGDYAWTTDARPSSSVIDEFHWYPVYYEGYLTEINDVKITQARKISVTDRTEYNKKADIFVTVYNNQSNEYVNSEEDLYIEEEMSERVQAGDEFRVCSKLKTRQILPSLARNLVQNGTEITDTNGWEAKTQNNNSLDNLGTGSYLTLMTIEAHPVNEMSEFNSKSELSGDYKDEIISDFYLKITSPYLKDCTEVSQEGEVQSDYLLNFGLVSQDYKIEKGKVYAIKIKTGDIVKTKAYFSYRSGLQEEEIEDDIENKVQEYEMTMSNYYKLISAFGLNEEAAIEILSASIGEKQAKDYINYFYSIIDKIDADKINNQLNSINESLSAILFGGKLSFISEDGKDITEVEGIVSIYDKNKEKNYQKTAAIAINSSDNRYKKSDINYLKYYISIKDTKLNTIFGSVTGLTKEVLRNWKNTYISYDTTLEDKINTELDKIIIGQGSLNSEGNYIIEGIEKGDNYMSFKEVFSPVTSSPYYVPSNTAINNIQEELTTKNYHVANSEGKRLWEYKKTLEKEGLPDEDKETEKTITIESETYLLFKANCTIEKPYVSILVESEPALINFDSINKTIYQDYTSEGVVFHVQTNKELYLDDQDIKLIKIDKNNVSESFKALIDFNDKEGTFKKDLRSLEWKDEYLIDNTATWQAKTSIGNPCVDKAFLLNKAEDCTLPYLVIINNEPAGIIYLTLEEVKKEDESENVV